MNLPISGSLAGHNAPRASFEVPLEMLAACHLRIDSQCTMLQRLVEHVALQGSDEQARTAATAVLRYFETAALNHHADEETDLFPALIESMAGSDATCIQALIDSLTSDHRRLESLWRCLSPALLSIAAGEPHPLPAADVLPFITSYRQHMAREDAELLPMADRLLSDSALESIGRAMRRRRGVL